MLHVPLKTWRTYKLHGSMSPLDNKVGHVADQVSGQAKVDEHEKDDEDHLGRVRSVEVAIPHCAHGGDGPVNGGNVPDPEAHVPKVGDDRADPRLALVRVLVSQ